MPEKINENIFKDETESLEKKPSSDFEFSKTLETEELVENINALTDAINHDGVVKNNDLDKMEKSLGGIMVEIDGDQFTLEELKNIPDIKENAKIWKEIKDGNFENTHKLTHLTLEVAEHLSKHQGILSLNGLASISDTVAENISKSRGNLFLNGLNTISDTTAEHLSKHHGDLHLNGLSSISDTTAKYLSKLQNNLYLDGLITISDTTAEHLSKLQGSLDLFGLTVVSDIGIKYLLKHKYLYVNNKIRLQIIKNK